MSATLAFGIDELRRRLAEFSPADSDRAVKTVNTVLLHGSRCGASDIHFEPTPADLSIRFRIDGLLGSVAHVDRSIAANVIARLKVLADLLTYRTDIPQEGSISAGVVDSAGEMRVSTFPTIHGEKAVVRVFQGGSELRELHQLGLPAARLEELTSLLQRRDGAVLLTGPSGSGKTTTIYACLRHLVSHGGGRHIVTIEDPVERWIDGVSQSQARPGTDFDFARGLRSLLRQDPEVVMVGEVRDGETASVAAEAALTGHLVISTLHAGSACGVLSRLLDMGVEPYVLASGVQGILSQRLVRRTCDACRARPGCERCHGTGYRGRLLLAELLRIDPSIRQGILARADTESLQAIAARSSWKSIRDAAADAVLAGETTADEVQRVLGPPT